jgi:tripartite-type tricarboxylate transporter receptor subunit TctC
MLNRTIAASFAFFALSTAALAQDYPTRPITMVVPFAAGGGIDASARIQALALGEILGQTVVVENVGGAAGTTGSARVAKAAPDGYTILMGNSGTHAYSQTLARNPPYNSITDFTPIGMMTDSPRILIARKSLPVDGLKQFVDYVKANHAKMQFGSAGVGSGTHIPCELLNSAMGVKITHLPFRGAGPVMQELIAGRVDYMCDTIQTGAAQVKQDAVKGIAVMATKRVSIIPNLGTTGEQGLPGVDASVWNAFFAPKGTPDAIVKKLNAAVGKMLDDPALRKKLEELGLEIVDKSERSPEYLAKHMKEEIERWGKVIRAAGIAQ